MIVHSFPNGTAEFTHQGYAIEIQGLVQGVGFRPFVHELAARLGLRGEVRNVGARVRIEVEGERGRVETFLRELEQRPPPLARVEEVRWKMAPVKRRFGFVIERSSGGAEADGWVGPDVAVCDDCLRELFDPNDRRYRYPFIACTQCGPRFTTIESIPYDRERTTLRDFPMCQNCRAEFATAGNRRFHAQTTVCGKCGPRLSVLDRTGRAVGIDEDPIGLTVAAFRRGSIVAVKGLGGFHLVCDARREDVVKELRARKRRESKAFAVLCESVSAASELCWVSEDEAELLSGREHPIVLLKKRQPCETAESVAPGNPLLGVMLPYTPLHHLLARQFEGPLVMTSGNETDEPIANETQEAVERLAGVADLFLSNDRRIRMWCDDSVVRVTGGRRVLLRRARGYAPVGIRLPLKCCNSVMAMGSQLKNTFAIGRGRQAILSQHLGDLDGYQSQIEYERMLREYERLFSFEAEILVHDLHPDYASTQRGLALAQGEGRRAIGVQHHHAHMAACMADNGINEAVIGVIFDGTGLGTDGTIWGGEFLTGDFRAFERAAHFRCVRMPGGEGAIREPWRMGMSYLCDAGEEMRLSEQSIPSGTMGNVKRMITGGLMSPMTSSCGRLLDGIAAIMGVRGRIEFEGQAAMELEWLAMQTEDDGVYPFAVRGDGRPMEVDTRPLISGVARDCADRVSKLVIARRVHSTVVEIVSAVCGKVRKRTGLEKVVLSGGVFVNALLLEGVVDRLEACGFRVFTHNAVPANDGGLSLGQLAIGAAREEGS